MAWIGAEELPVHFANSFVGLVGPHAIFLDLGSSVPPTIESEEDLANLQYFPVKPIARIALTPQGLDGLIETLEDTRRNFQEFPNIADEGGS